MVAAGTNLAFIRQSLGHMSASSTARYCHVTDEQAAAEARKALHDILTGTLQESVRPVLSETVLKGLFAGWVLGSLLHGRITPRMLAAVG